MQQDTHTQMCLPFNKLNKNNIVTVAEISDNGTYKTQFTSQYNITNAKQMTNPY